MEPNKTQAADRHLIGTVSHLADLVSYQEGSVVSRTVMKGDAGSVTVFAFDKFQGLGEHTVPYDALVVLLDGEAEITIAGEASRLKQGDVIIMPANQPHAVQAVERFKMILTMIRA
ncbi:MAG: cupin domain-containing protein [Gemmatimonadales bacterium]|nr:cupin domain-containing protein [Gemmatimonadales bacterium]NIN12049.1 cupin domain-containing protein [Gemmatimonadales bacterium]NIR03284.1 cupin domain-containing protein [Gemmatimonadales bacterium]NIS66964.1 cupin domain-containing protein [Gemmatimonadales bacterium]